MQPTITKMPFQEQPQQTQEPQRAVENFRYSKRVVLKSVLCREDKGLGLVGRRVVVGGWVKSRREKEEEGAGVVPLEAEGGGGGGGRNVSCCEVLLSRIPLLRSLARVVARRGGGLVGREEGHDVPAVYLKINDGSCVASLQVLVGSSTSLLSQVMSIGTSILVEGVLERPPVQGKHALELRVENIIHIGVVDLKTYPLAKTRLSSEFLRSYPHLRPRTTTVASITHIRNALSYATHTFFHDNGFIHVHMPVITTTDTGTSNMMFQVTTLLNKSESTGKPNAPNGRESISLEVIKSSIKEKSDRIEELKRTDSNREALLAALQDLQKTNQLVLQLEEKQNATLSKVGELDFSKDFFSRKAYLSMSAQLYLESYACALGSVYTFGLTFRAEDSRSRNQLAEMWMVEVELAFAELEDAMNWAEDFLKFIIHSVVHDCSDDLTFISKRIDKNLMDRLQAICSEPFARIAYTEALKVLNKVADKSFRTKPEWGVKLSEEHESYLTDEVYKSPVIIYGHPKEVEPFYVHIKEDGKTASTFDIVAPKVGVLARGSQREDNIDKISTRMDEQGLSREQHEWYLDLRRHGTVKHSGFSVGFENVVMFATGLDDVRDAVPFPRSSGSASI